jgi:hypothetical protein
MLLTIVGLRASGVNMRRTQLAYHRPALDLMRLASKVATMIAQAAPVPLIAFIWATSPAGVP